MEKKEKNSLAWYEFSIFKQWPELKHGVFTRYGGQSGMDKNELCLAFNDVDDERNVITNLRKAETGLGISAAAFVKQTHSKNILLLKRSDNYCPQNPRQVREDYDAVIATEPGISLLVKLADCQGIILFEPMTKLLALVHSGWRGSVQNILAATVEKMKNLGADTSEIRAGISPSLGPCCAEFKNYRQELPAAFEKFRVSEYHFDFWSISQHQLTGAGLKAGHIEISSICTKCSEEFFSYRRGDKWQRMGLLASVQI